MADNKKGCAVCCVCCLLFWTAVVLALVFGEMYLSSAPQSATLPSTSPSPSTSYFTSEELGLNVECTFYCGDALLPGYPRDMSLHFADCSSIRTDNCKSPCIEMANELYAPQTWLGVIVAYFFIFNTFCA